MDTLSGLNIQQQQAVTAGLGPVLVLAGPGSGKTRVLTHRIAYLIGALGVRPYQILAVTFTNKAAREMENRVKELLGDLQNETAVRSRSMPSLGTFHATCARILRREAGYLPFNENFVIFDADDQIKVVKNAIRELNLDEKVYRPQSVHAAISNAKNELYFPDDFPVNTYREEVIARVYRRYHDLLLANNAVDFDDLLLWTAYLLAEIPEVHDRYARRYEHVLVDEFQDTNLAQYTLLKRLVSFHRNLYVVGDTDQSIYGWRGADYRNVLRFEQDFPDAQIILLEQNYRSTQSILDVAMEVINRHPQRKQKRLFTDRGQGKKISLQEMYDDRAEAQYVVDIIASRVAQNEAKPGDFAVMYRTNAQSRLLEEAFLYANLPYRLVGAQRFYGRREVKDVIAYLRLAHNPSDDFSLARAINTPPRGIGSKTMNALQTYAQQAGLSAGQALLALATQETLSETALAGRVGVALSRFGRLLAGWQRAAKEDAPMILMDRILAEIDYQAYIDDNTDEGHDRWENVQELRRLASEYREQELAFFLEQVALVSDQDTLEGNVEAPTLLTLHAAKGLEFPVVFIVGLNDGVLPHSRSFDDPESMQEERRLLYVGITRAMNQLYLLYPQYRNAYGYPDQAEPSRFLADIPEKLIEGKARAPRVKPDLQRDKTTRRWDNGQIKESFTLERRFYPGMRVSHPLWAEGMVLNSRIQDDEEIVDIFFEDVGLKRVAASLARLEIVSS